MNKHREQLQIDYFDLLAEPGDLSLEQLVGDLDNLYTAPTPPPHLASLGAVLKETRTERFMIPNYPQPEPAPSRRRFGNWPRQGRPRPFRLVLAAMAILLLIGGMSFAAIRAEKARYNMRLAPDGRVFVAPTIIPVALPANYKLPLVPGMQEIEVNQAVANALVSSFLDINPKCNSAQPKESACMSPAILPNSSRPALRIFVSDYELEQVRANTLKAYSSAGYLPGLVEDFYENPPLPDVFISTMPVTGDPAEVFKNLAGVDKVGLEKFLAQLKGRKTVMFALAGFGLQGSLKLSGSIPILATPVPAPSIPPLATPMPGSSIERPRSPDAPATP